MVTVDELKEDRQRMGGYLHYSIAKREGIKRGSRFTVEGIGAEFEAVEYTTWRPDINRRFSGFRCEEVKNGK